MKRPHQTAAKRARELKQKAKRDAKLARKHARKPPSASDEATPRTAPGELTDKAESEGR